MSLDSASRKKWEATGKDEGSVVNVGVGRQRQRLCLYMNEAPLCGNGRGLRTHQSCDLGFEGWSLYTQEYKFRV